MNGIKREFSVARIPQQNRVAKRKNMTLIEAARTMLADSLLPIPFWAEAVNTACYAQNRVLVTKPHNKTPYELLLGRTHSIGFMRPFGYHVTILNTLDPLENFDGKADEGFLVGYSVSSKAFRVFNSRARIVQETLHINFLENQPNVAGSGPTRLFDIDTLTQSMNYQPVVTGNQPNHTAGIQENLNAELKSEVHVSPSSSDKPKKHDEKAKREAKGKSPVVLSTGVRNLSEEFKDFSSNSTNGVNAASTPVTAVGLNSTNNTNSFNATGPFDNAVSSTFEIGGKSSFVDPSQYPDYPNMPALEDIIYSDDEEDVSVEADFSNLETSITVSPILTTRVHKDHLVTQIIGDLSLAPQARSMARMVKEQDLPEGKRAIGSKWVFRNKKDERGIVIKNKARLVVQGHTQEERIDYKEVFAPVVRIEAIRLFIAYASFMGFMVYQMDVKSAFLYGTIKEEVYVCQPPRFEDPNYPYKVYKVVKALYGLHQAPRACQDKYVAEILRKFGLTVGKSASTPIDTEKPLLKDPDGEDVDVHTYRYLKGKPHLGLWYLKDLPFNLMAYSDSDYAGASLDRKSTTGGCQFLGCRLISWQCKKQTVVATSSIEAEYIAAASCCAQVLWIQNKLLDYGNEALAIAGQTATGVNTPRCDEDRLEIMELMYALMVNPTIYVSCVKQFWTSVSIKKSNDVVRLQVLIDRKKVIITKDTIRQALHLDDAAGVDCLPNEEIFAELARMGYKKPSTKLTFYKAFFLTQ
nr:hypothetical protein [Tanacetum cinerariifolium]